MLEGWAAGMTKYETVSSRSGADCVINDRANAIKNPENPTFYCWLAGWMPVPTVIPIPF